MAIQAAAPLTGAVVSRTFFFMTIHEILLLPKEQWQGNTQQLLAETDQTLLTSVDVMFFMYTASIKQVICL